MINKFKLFLKTQDKSENTIRSYSRTIKDYNNWCKDTFGKKPNKLLRENIIEYKCFLQNVKKLDAKSINLALKAIAKYNKFLVELNIQKNLVISKNDYLKIQAPFVNPATISKTEVEKFRQDILENRSKRDFALVTLLAYTGMRISEATNLKVDDINLQSKEIIVRKGKGNKQRLVIANDKIINAVKSYIKERSNYRYKDSEYLFISRQSGKLDNSVVNRFFNTNSKTITPHTLRHFFCSYAIENGFSVHEVASLAGHTNIHTTMVYTNPSKEEMKNKINLL